MTWDRFFAWCFCASPVLLAGLIIWSYANIGLAIVFMVAGFFGSGYVARWLDEGITREQNTQSIMRKWRGPV